MKKIITLVLACTLLCSTTYLQAQQDTSRRKTEKQQKKQKPKKMKRDTMRRDTMHRPPVAPKS